MRGLSLKHGLAVPALIPDSRVKWVSEPDKPVASVDKMKPGFPFDKPPTEDTKSHISVSIGALHRGPQGLALPPHFLPWLNDRPSLGKDFGSTITASGMQNAIFASVVSYT